MEKNNNMAVVAVVAILALIGGGVGIYALTRNADDSTSEVSSIQESSMSERDTLPAPTSNIVELAVATSDLSTLVAAVQAGELVDTLSSEGPFTVFAPTNAAFSALPEGTLESLLLPENKDQLVSILTYHVVSGKVMSSNLSNGQVITTVQGATLTVEIVDGQVMLVDANGNKATVVMADVEASNGVVHVIDAVVLP